MNRLTAISLFAAGSLALVAVGCSDAPLSAPTDSPVQQENVFGSGKLIPTPADAEVVEDSYIVVFHDAAVATPAGFAKTAASIASQYTDISVNGTYQDAFRGFSATIPEARLQSLINDPRVKYIERDVVVRACSTSTYQTMCWGMSYIGADSSTTRSGDNSGDVTGVKVYVVDTGIDPNHADLNVITGINYGTTVYVAGVTTLDTTAWADDNGHGTHVAGTIAAKDNGMYTVGVVPGAPLYSVKIFNQRGSGTVTGICKGIEWIKRHRASVGGGPAVANMSLSSSISYTLDQSVRSLVASGVVVGVAAGNEAIEASRRSPARVQEAIVVGSMASNGTYSTFSNYGPPIDIVAPGTSILSLARGGATSIKSGTSMATPHAVGAAALYLAQAGNSTKTPAQVETALENDAAAWGVSFPTGTPNKVLRVVRY